MKAALHALRQRTGDSAIALPALCQQLPEMHEGSVELVLKHLEDQNVLMYRDGQIYLI